MAELPRGTVTLLVTDMEDSTALVQRLGRGWTDLLADHNRLLRDTVSAGGGVEVERAGDSFLFAFTRARDAVTAAIACQRALGKHEWPEGTAPRVAIGLHTGEPDVLDDAYTGAMVHRTVLIASLGAGGDVLLSNTTRQLVEDDLPEGASLQDIGPISLRGFDRPERVHRLVAPGLGTGERSVAASLLPGGTVTFLFTDIERSTQLQRQLGDRWPEAHATHHRLLREAFGDAGGREVDTQGDALFAVFTRARDGLAAAATAQRSLHAYEWPDAVELAVRMGIHTGEPTVGGEGYLGLDVVRAARICSLASGGQVLVSETTRALVRGDDLGGLALEDLGEHRLKDFDEPERLFQLAGPDLVRAAPRLGAAASPPVPALRVGERGAELAARALAAAEGFEGLGERIERSVDDVLARAGIPKAPKTSAPEAPKPSAPEAVPWRWIAFIVAAGLAAVVVPVVVLLVLLL